MDGQAHERSDKVRSQEQVQHDSKKLEDIMNNYSGADGAHAGFIITAEDKRFICIGGWADLIGVCMSEMVARQASFLPGEAATGFIDTVCMVAKEMLKSFAGGVKN